MIQTVVKNRFVVFRNFNISSLMTLRPGKCIMSLSNVKKVVYEQSSKSMTIYYFSETYPEVLQGIDESLFEKVTTELVRSNSEYNGNPDNQF